MPTCLTVGAHSVKQDHSLFSAPAAISCSRILMGGLFLDVPGTTIKNSRENENYGDFLCLPVHAPDYPDIPL